MEPNLLLETYLRQLLLPTFVKDYSQFAEDAARTNQDYLRFLLALVEQEITQREQNVLQKRIKAARFPVKANNVTSKRKIGELALVMAVNPGR